MCIRDRSGSIYVDGQDIYDEGYDMKALRSKVGLVFQYPDHQLFETTCFEAVSYTHLDVYKRQTMSR